MVQRDSLSSQDEEHIDPGVTFSWRERDMVLTYDTKILVCTSAEKLFNMELTFLSHMMTLWLWFHSYVTWEQFQVEKAQEV